MAVEWGEGVGLDRAGLVSMMQQSIIIELGEFYQWGYIYWGLLSLIL